MRLNIKNILRRCLESSTSLFFCFIFILLYSSTLFAVDDNQVLLEKTINQFPIPDHALSGAEQEKFFTIMNNAVSNGAKLSEIKTDLQMNNLPIFKICQEIIERVEKLFNPGLYLNWILSYRLSNRMSNSDLLAKPEELISLAMGKGVNLRQIYNANPQAEDAFRPIYGLINMAKNYLQQIS